MTVPSQLIGLLEAVTRIPASQMSSFTHPAFVALRDWVKREFPDAGPKDGLNFALSAALDRLGLFRRHQSEGLPSPAIADAAARLVDGLGIKRVWRTHLCPLDVADDIPALSFGPNAVHEVSFEALQDLFAPLGGYAATLDPRFAQFRWLIVRVEATLDFEPGRRASPFLFLDVGKDFAEIKPYKRKFPVAVEKALFALLLAPWEDLVNHADIDWRAFQIPWVYTIDEDLFVRPAPLPSANGLSWAPDFYDRDGETVEFERPLTYSWADPIEGLENWLNDGRWRDVEAALASDLFSTPIVHFFVSAFLATGIDEFIAHMTVLDAALGLRADQSRERTLGARISAILGDATAATTYSRLFSLRSEYVHGRPMSEISGADRNDARRLARRVADALVSQAQSPIADRTAFLQALAPSRPLKRKP